MRARRLAALLAYCSRTSSFYRARWSRPSGDVPDSDQLPQLSPLSKADLREYLSRADAPPAACRRTTGTSGEPLYLPVSRSERWFDVLAWQSMYRRCGLRWFDRQVKLLIPSGPVPAGQSRWSWPRARLSTWLPVAEKIRCLRELRPGALFGHASILGEIALALEEAGEVLPVPRVFSTSDMLWPVLRDRLRERFAAEVFDVYGAVETGPIAYECRRHEGYHVAEEWVKVELLDDAGLPARRGRVACTVLWRRRMPLVRYLLGDCAEWAEAPCPCGDPRPRLAVLHGREHDLVRMPDGSSVSASQLCSVLTGAKTVRQFQIEQETPRRFVYRIVPAPGFDESAAAAIRQRFESRFGNLLEIHIERVSEIVQPPGAKFTPFISLERRRQLDQGVTTRGKV